MPASLDSVPNRAIAWDQSKCDMGWPSDRTNDYCLQGFPITGCPHITPGFSFDFDGLEYAEGAAHNGNLGQLQISGKGLDRLRD